MTSQALSWEIGIDGQLLRSEAGCRLLLQNMGMHVQSSNTFGRNDCLIDSVLLCLTSSGHIASSLYMQQRNMTCVRVRDDLRSLQLTSATSDEYLSHDEHLETIFKFLLEECSDLWVDVREARQFLCFTFLF